MKYVKYSNFKSIHAFGIEISPKSRGLSALSLGREWVNRYLKENFPFQAYHLYSEMPYTASGGELYEL